MQTSSGPTVNDVMDRVRQLWGTVSWVKSPAKLSDFREGVLAAGPAVVMRRVEEWDRAKPPTMADLIGAADWAGWYRQNIRVIDDMRLTDAQRFELLRRVKALPADRMAKLTVSDLNELAGRKPEPPERVSGESMEALSFAMATGRVRDLQDAIKSGTSAEEWLRNVQAAGA